jgi:hypothetical protein
MGVVDDGHEIHVAVSQHTDVALCGAVGDFKLHWAGDVTCPVCIAAFKRRQTA